MPLLSGEFNYVASLINHPSASTGSCWLRIRKAQCWSEWGKSGKASTSLSKLMLTYHPNADLAVLNLGMSRPSPVWWMAWYACLLFGRGIIAARYEQTDLRGQVQNKREKTKADPSGLGVALVLKNVPHNLSALSSIFSTHRMARDGRKRTDVLRAGIFVSSLLVTLIPICWPIVL